MKTLALLLLAAMVSGCVSTRTQQSREHVAALKKAAPPPPTPPPLPVPRQYSPAEKAALAEAKARPVARTVVTAPSGFVPAGTIAVGGTGVITGIDPPNALGMSFIHFRSGANEEVTIYASPHGDDSPVTGPYSPVVVQGCYHVAQSYVAAVPGFWNQHFWRGESLPCVPASGFAPAAAPDRTKLKTGRGEFTVVDANPKFAGPGVKVYRIVPAQ